MKNYLVCIILLLCIAFLLTSCWGSVELSKKAIVSGVAITTEPSGQPLITVQLIKPGSLKGESDGGGDGEQSFFTASATGETVFDAMRQFTKQISRKLYFGQNRLILFDEKTAKEGIKPYLDFFLRDHEVRKRSWVMVCKEDPGKILGISGDVEKIPSSEMIDMLMAQSATSEVAKADLFVVALALNSKYISPSVSYVGLMNTPQGEKTAYKGTAVFKSDKLVGYLEPKESRGFLWVNNKIKSGIIVVKSPADNTSNISLEIHRASSKFVPKYENNKLSFEVNVSARLAVGDVTGELDVYSIETLNELEKRAIEAIHNEINSYLNKVKYQYKTDISGFGLSIYRKYPQQWQQIKDQWPDYITEVEFEPKIEVHIRHTGIITNPITE